MSSIPETVLVTPPRRGVRLGAIALILAVIAPAWLLAAASLGLWAAQDGSPGWVGVVAAILVIPGWVVVPLGFLLAVVLGIAAVVANRLAGKVMGGMALLLVLFSMAGFIIFWAVALGAV